MRIQVQNSAYRRLIWVVAFVALVPFFVTGDNTVATTKPVYSKRSNKRKGPIKRSLGYDLGVLGSVPQPAPAPSPTPVPEPAPGNGVVDVKAPEEKPEFFGELDLRPTWVTSQNKAYMGSAVEVGFKWPHFTLSYQQQFLSNLFNGQGLLGNGNFVLSNGFIRFKPNDITSNPNGLSLGWEPRVYLPTNGLDSNNGFIMAIRNYFKADLKLGSSLSILAYEVPIFHLYSQSRGFSGEYNPLFENRVAIAPSLKLFGDGELTIPVFFSLMMRSNGVTEKRFWIYPEFLYALSPDVKIGVAYQTGNVLDIDFTNLVIDNSFRDGIAQFIFKMRF